MASYFVLFPPGKREAGQDTVFIKDGFSWLAFLFPLPWLLWRRLWLPAILILGAYIAVGALSELFMMDIISTALTMAISLWAGFEGPFLRVCKMEKRGWHLAAVLSAHGIDEAEEIFFRSAENATTKDTVAPLFAGANDKTIPDLALGLIGPIGGR